MKKLFLTIAAVLYLSVCIHAAASQNPVLLIKKYDSKLYASSKNAIYIVKKGNLTSIFESKEEITDFLPFKNDILICTSKKLLILKPNSETTQVTHHLTSPVFVSLCSNYGGEVFVATRMEGVFKITGDSLTNVYYTFPVNDVSFTKDSSLWVATDIGLHQLKNNKTVIYKEEGTTNFELADNFVENLIPDNLSALWIKMPEAVSVISFSEKGHHQGHLPTLKFIGSPDNEIYSVSFHENTGYLFSTKEGMILMPIGKKEDKHKFFDMAEEKALDNPNANLNVLRNVYYKGVPVKSGFHIVSKKNTIIAATGNKLTEINLKYLVFK